MQKRIDTYPSYSKEEYSKKQPITFHSVTRSILEISKQHPFPCPRCGKSIDLNRGVEWYGPTSFGCNACGYLVGLSHVVKAIDKMGLLDEVFLR